MNEIVLTRGIPGSGKTAWALGWLREQPERRARSNRDDLRVSLFGTHTVPYSCEEVITVVQRQTVDALLKAGRDVVVDDMHLRPRYVREWVRFGRAHGAEVRTVEMPVDVELSVVRDATRDRTVGESVIRGIAAKYVPGGKYLPVAPIEDEKSSAAPYTGTPGKPRAIMVDIDGTIALMGDRSPYDLTRVSEDKPNSAVIAAVQAAAVDGCKILFCSGREESVRVETAGWLRRHLWEKVPGGWYHLFMRPAGDQRRDSIVKAELFDRHIRDNFDVQYILDDRQQVVNMWREMGLTVFQVAPGDF